MHKDTLIDLQGCIENHKREQERELRLTRGEK